MTKRSKRKEISVGNWVTVYFTGGSRCISGEVISKAVATGDCWVIEDEFKSLHYIQTFERVVRYSEEVLRKRKEGREELRNTPVSWR